MHKENMKRIEAFVPTIKRSVVVNAAIKAGSGGVTVAETRGKGAGERPMIRGAREQQDTFQNTTGQTQLPLL